MRTKRLTLALLVVTALLGTTAASAFATATVESQPWSVGATESGVVPLSGEKAISASIGENPTVGKKILMTWTVAGFPLKTVATGVSCVECKIFNEGGTFGPATGTGRLKFTGVTFAELPACKVHEGVINSGPLVFQADYMEGKGWLLKIVPKGGEGNVAFTIKNETSGGGAICPFAGEHLIAGANFGLFRNQTQVFKTEQALDLSPVISAAAGSSWTVGAAKIPFEVTGTIVFQVGGNFFGVK